MRTLKILALLFLFTVSIQAQESLSQLLKKYNTESVPYMYVDSLQNSKDTIILLDAREEKEYKVSHLKNAILVGYDTFKIETTAKKLPDKNAKIIVYCSLGIRSEDVAEKLISKGYTNVYNLYGGIFEWKNKGNKVYDTKEIESNKVHTFNKEWSKWLKKGEKIYE